MGRTRHQPPGEPGTSARTSQSAGSGAPDPTSVAGVGAEGLRCKRSVFDIVDSRTAGGPRRLGRNQWEKAGAGPWAIYWPQSQNGALPPPWRQVQDRDLQGAFLVPDSDDDSTGVVYLEVHGWDVEFDKRAVSGNRRSSRRGSSSVRRCLGMNASAPCRWLRAWSVGPSWADITTILIAG